MNLADFLGRGSLKFTVHIFTFASIRQNAGSKRYPCEEGAFPPELATDLHEDMAAEQKARATYENLINLTDDPDLADGLKFLREREVVHFQRFGETLNHLQGYMNGKKFY